MYSFKLILAVCCVAVGFLVCAKGYLLKGPSWCDRDLCPNGGRHIACNNDGNFSPACQPDVVVLNIKPFKSMILHEHNKRRNFIALGLLPGYYPATRMATMKWDDELAYLALLNLKTCNLDHDECYNTYRYRNSGQCLYGLYSKRSHINMTNLLEQAVGGWFSEYNLIDSSYISSFRVEKHFKEYGHFAEIVVDRNTHVGCAAIRFTRPDYPHVYIVNIACNYASIYALDTPVYRVGKPVSKCRTGRNPYYPGLCSKKEKYNPNYS
ncbi:antigen 5 like allergen Cul n 1-like [Eupeodes corollae]|uniref:antigen 5 like allergen Cul n 1-like n=1 Tax=Eupeodes corollae TaxID=290404 RepID=UPI002490A2D0|nr:antigen 5 like allergen Cul n 1-like [Eupeodes corollae]